MKHSLERDLYDSEYIRSKAADNNSYCQNLYAALCNNQFLKLAVEPILLDDRWSCSWRYAGEIADRLHSNMGNADYMQYYCTGMGDITGGLVSEGTVTDEIRTDLLHLGWAVVIDNRVPE